MSAVVSRETANATTTTVPEESHPIKSHMDTENGDDSALSLGIPIKTNITDDDVKKLEIPEEIRRRAQVICDEFEANHQKMLPVLSERRRQYRDKLQERLWAAACWRDYQLGCVQKAFEAEVKQIEAEYESEKSNLKEKLLGELLEERRKLVEHQQRISGGTGGGGSNVNGDGSGNVSSTINRGGQRKLRSKRGLDGGEVGSRGGAGGGGGRRKQALTGLDALGVNTMLPEPDVYEDLLVILRNESGSGGPMGRKTRQGGVKTALTTLDESTISNTTTSNSSINTITGQSIPITLKGDSVKIGSEELFRGDAVLIDTPDGSQLTGTISGLGSKEVWIRIEDGAKLKITFSQLQAGRYRLQHTPDANNQEKE